MTDPERSPPSLVIFARGVISRLAIWPILRVAVQENWGGPKSDNKRTWLASELVDTFENQDPPPDDQYIEEMLLQVMEDEFDCVVEDGSCEDVAKDIVKMWEESQIGKHDIMLRFEDMAEKLKGKKVAAQITLEENEVDGGDSGDEDGWEDEIDEEEMDVDEAPKLIERGQKNDPEVDEDGFTLVKRKAARR